MKTILFSDNSTKGDTMMTLSNILMASAGVLAIAVAATYLIPSKVHVARTAVIKADPQVVWLMTVRFRSVLTLRRGNGWRGSGPKSGTG
jgi:hypothetical protein